MSFFITKQLRRLASELNEAADRILTLKGIKEAYGISVDPHVAYEYIQAADESLRRLPQQLVKDCGITVLGFQDLGPSKEFYPNHGKYMDGALLLNERLLEDPFLDVDMDSGQALNKLDQTLFHELGHGWDEAQGNGKELCREKDWLDLSGWSSDARPGLKRVVIKEPGMPEMKGEYYYSPEAQFVRFYGKRNPWDDWADSFAYYVGGLKSFLPENKRAYFDEKLGCYYKGD